MTEKHGPLSTEDRLSQLVDDYYQQTSRGCRSILADTITGQSRKRAEEIAQITGLESTKDVITIFGSVNLITAAARTKDEGYQKLIEAFMKGTGGGQSTGNQQGDETIATVALFAKSAFEKSWEVKQNRTRKPSR